MTGELTKSLNFNPDLNCIGPNKISRYPEAVLRIRHQALMRTYKGVYCIDNPEIYDSTLNIKKGSESILFWSGENRKGLVWMTWRRLIDIEK